jgi:hypothetical protein
MARVAIYATLVLFEMHGMNAKVNNITAKISIQVVIPSQYNLNAGWAIGTVFRSIRVDYKSRYGNSCHICPTGLFECKSKRSQYKLYQGLNTTRSIRVDYKSRYGNSCHICPTGLFECKSKRSQGLNTT